MNPGDLYSGMFGDEAREGSGDPRAEERERRVEPVPPLRPLPARDAPVQSAADILGVGREAKAPRKRKSKVLTRVNLTHAGAVFWQLVQEGRRGDAAQYLLNYVPELFDPGTREDGMDRLVLPGPQDRIMVRQLVVEFIANGLRPGRSVAPTASGIRVPDRMPTPSPASTHTLPPRSPMEIQEAQDRCAKREAIWSRQADAAFRARYPMVRVVNGESGDDWPTAAQFDMARRLIRLERRLTRPRRRR